MIPAAIRAARAGTCSAILSTTVSAITTVKRATPPATMLVRLVLVLLCAGLALAGNARAASADDLLEPDKAFRFSVRAVDGTTVELTWRIAKGYYLYRDKFHFSLEPADAGEPGEARYPQGLVHEDAFFGKTRIYRDEVRILLPVRAARERLTVKAVSQGCADVGVCYVPHEQKAQVRLQLVSAPGGGAQGGGQGGGLLDRLGAGGASSAAPPGAALPGGPGVRGAPAFASDESRFLGALESGGLMLAMGLFFLAGIALTFTPCVLPMIPILSGIIVGEPQVASGAARRRQALMLSLAYVAGMAVTYTAIGVAAALTGQFFAAMLQNPWVLSAFALVFVLLALSMFGLYELRLPSGLQARLSAASQRLPGGHYGGVVLMGALSAVIVSPCVAAPLAGALLYISQTGDAWLGGGALFALALGMGVPLVAVGVTEGALLPRGGPWMRAVQRVFGVLLLAVAIWVVSPVLPAPVVLFAWGVLLIGSGIFLRALDPLPETARGARRLAKAAGIVALIAGAAQLVGAFAGGRDPLAPLAGLRAASAEGAGSAAQGVRFERVRSPGELDARLKAADRIVMLDFYADWCVSCKEMERFTFSDARVRERLARMSLLQVDVTANTADDQALLRRFRLFGPPGIVFFDAKGAEIPGLRVIGYQPVERFLKTLELAQSF